MQAKIRPEAKRLALMLSLLYFSSYVMRLNFSVMLVKILGDTGSTKSELSIVLTAMTVIYGGGQIISGILGDRIKPRVMLSAGLALTALCNIAMFFCREIPAMTVVWGLNGFAQALMWPPIVRTMSTYLSDGEYGYASVRVAWGSSIATILLYLVCPLLLPYVSWRVIMLACAAIGILVLILWIAVSRRLTEALPTYDSPTSSEVSTAKKSPLPTYIAFPIAFIMLGIILQGMLRDGVTNWMPSYLLETFALTEENAIITSVLPAILSMFSFLVFERLHRRFFPNEVLCAAVIFLFATLSAFILYLLNTLTVSPLFSTLFMALIIATMHGINLMLISIAPKRFAKNGKVSTYSGLLNACTYIGAALSSYGFAALAESFGWSFTILTWIFIAAFGAVACLVAAPLWKKFQRDNAN